MAKKNNTTQEEPIEKKLWKTADKLRKNMDAAEYKHVVLGLIFLKYISDAFEEQYQKLVAQKSEGADPEDKNEYTAEKVFYVPLETAIKKYQNNLLTTAQIIEELIRIAKEVKDLDDDAKRLGLSNDELAFYDALETNDSAVKVLGDETLKTIAKEIADKVKRNATIDWTIRESARAKLMVLVKRTLTKYGYPPDKQQKAIDTVLKQAELIADELVNN
ncbi:MAG: hypothetical protein CO129_02410 [Ignavibacteriales bacterium CG_4_9_14_3_um_filter_34_10]|nr:MAG: hypothetical protein CO129_02410 [Ignavibacteriales bacterium CG_4_9_14_3_um_filter_34_10]